MTSERQGAPPARARSSTAGRDALARSPLSRSPLGCSPLSRSPLSSGERTSGDRTSVYLHPGRLLTSTQPHSVTTILGSCVAVCVFDETGRAGGINHYLLPHRTGAMAASPRFGGTAIRQLVDSLVGLGCRRADLRAKVFGGARVIDAFHDSAFAIGAQNARVAFELLEAEGIAVVAQDVGGDRGRKLLFQTDDGAARVAVI